MNLYRFDAVVGTAVDAYGSSFVLSRLARSDGTTLRAACFHPGPGGKVGRHQATARAGARLDGLGCRWYP